MASEKDAEQAVPANDDEQPTEKKPIAEKEIPWCIMFLCGGAIACHICVLMGNLACAGAIGKIGSSVYGWSNVGTGIAVSLHEELDELLSNVTLQLTDAINKTMGTQDMIDNMLSMMGGTAVASGAEALMQISLLQTDGEMIDDPFSKVMNSVMKMLGNLPSFQEALTAMQQMFVNLKPALEQVGVWVESFADKVQATVETFGTTMDRVQKIFDQLMSKANPDAGSNAEQMQHETFNLFDTDSDGMISEQDLLNCADLYAINALKGSKAAELITTYDADGSGSLDFLGGTTNEFGLMVEDPSIVAIMATLLRAYAKRMSMVAGNVAAARMRDEVATNMVSYFQLVCSRNITKVGWVSQMLTNGTLPMPFTADVMAELALQKDDPDVLTVADVGEIVVGMMMTLDADYVGQAFDLMSTADHWTTEGFDEEDQPGVVQQVSAWMQSGPDAVAEIEKNMVKLAKMGRTDRVLDEEEPESQTHDETSDKKKHRLHKHSPSLLQEEQKSESEHQLLEVMALMPEVAKRMTRERMQEHRLNRWRNRAKKRLHRFDTEAKRLLLDNLMHGEAASDGGGVADLAEQALAKGVPAKPETLLFAQWLSANGTSTADQLQDECMTYTGQSSSPLDAFNTQVQAMVKKLSGFITMMKKYADPTGIQHIEDMIDEFASMGMSDIFKVVGTMIVDVLMASVTGGGGPGGAAAAALPDSSDNSSSNVSSTTALPTSDNDSSLLMINSMHSPGLRPEIVLSSCSKAHLVDASQMLKGLTGRPNLLKPSGHPKQKHMLLRDRLKRSAVPMAHWKKSQQQTAGTVRLQEAKYDQPEGGDDGQLSGIWEQVGNFLHEMEKILPTSIELLKFARKEVSAVASNLDSIFGMLGGKGKAIFVLIAGLYAEIWTGYFIFVFGLTFSILIYGFWASGWFGGPQPVPKKLGVYQPPSTFLDRCACCYAACCECCSSCHDTQSCFWSFIILFQVIVLLLFIMSLVFCILAGIQMFMGSSCMQLYIITDTKVCTESLGQFATFLSSFNVGHGEVPLSMACQHHELLTCDLIHDKMFQAGIMTVAGSFVSVIFSFELIFAIAIIHERARWRRVINEIEMDLEEEAEDKAEKAKSG